MRSTLAAGAHTAAAEIRRRANMHAEDPVALQEPHGRFWILGFAHGASAGTIRAPHELASVGTSLTTLFAGELCGTESAAKRPALNSN